MLLSKATAALLAIALAGSQNSGVPHVSTLTHGLANAELTLPQPATAEDHLRCATGKLVIRQQPRVEGRLHEAFVEVGTAFFIDSMGDMLTAAHVYFGVPPLREGWVERRTLILENLGPIELPPRTADETPAEHHLDVVRFATNLQPPCFLNLASSRHLAAGAELQTIGYPAQPEHHISFEDHHPHRGYFQTGLLLDRALFPDNRSMLRAAFFGEEGMSGSPICNLTGDVVGVLLFKEHNGHSFVLAAPAEDLGPVLENSSS
jgi:hypothetical protein